MTDEQFGIIVELLTDIRSALVVMTLRPEDSDECEHPEDQRINMSTMGDLNHWVCRVCRWDNKEHTKPMN